MAFRPLFAAALFFAVLPACASSDLATLAAPAAPDVESLFSSAAQEVLGEVRPDCMALHLREALEQNRTRLPLYAAQTQGASERISKRLIALEELSLALAPRIDEPSVAYHEVGIPIVCDAVVPMAATPAFEAVNVAGVAEAFAPIDGDAIAHSLRASLTHAGPEAAAVEAIRWLEKLQNTPHRHCMVRHVLESVARMGLLYPSHEQLARVRNMPSPLGLEEDMLRAHFAGLGMAASLDRDAAPLQARGVPILCNDLPVIPLPGARAEHR